MDEILSSTGLLDQTTLSTRHQPQDKGFKSDGGELPAVVMVSSHPDELSSTRQTQTHTSSSSSCVVVSPGASQLLEPGPAPANPVWYRIVQ
jgi:hypothetical protein